MGVASEYRTMSTVAQVITDAVHIHLQTVKRDALRKKTLRKWQEKRKANEITDQ